MGGRPVRARPAAAAAHRRPVGKMWLDLGLIGVFAGLSFCLAALTHRHIVRPLRKLEAIASAVRETKDYGLRAEDTSRDEIGRVTAAFDDMLSELAAAHARESAERTEFARVTRVTAMGEMAASIAHEVNQPLAAIVSSGHAGLRWLDNETPEIDRVAPSCSASSGTACVRARWSAVCGRCSRRTCGRGARSTCALSSPRRFCALRGELQREQISLEVEVARGCANVLGGPGAVAAGAREPDNQRHRRHASGTRPAATASARGQRRRIRRGADRGADTGSGIDARVRDRVFDPFVTTKASGMGLGLPICRSIVEAHGGRIWASAGSPHGTVFRLTLPVRDAGEA